MGFLSTLKQCILCCGILSTPPMQTKATISLENRKDIGGCTSSQLSWGKPFFFTNMIASILICQSISHILTDYFSSRYIIHIPNRNTKIIGAWMISFGFGFGFREVHVFITMKIGKEVKVMLPSQSMRMSRRHDNQPVIFIGFNIETVNSNSI